jgi:putative peptidoglycan lipid II flippase
MYDFNHAVSRSISRLLCVSLLATGWLVALAVPVAGLLKGGRLHQADSLLTARYLAIFSLSLALWSAQGIYARAFYAARNTVIPAVSGTLVTLGSVPIYYLLFHRMGVEGLAFASDIGILAHTVALAILLHRHRLVSLATLDYAELARVVLCTLAGFIATEQVVSRLPTASSMAGNLILLGAGTAVWALATAAAMRLTQSTLIGQLKNRKAT